MKVAIFLFILVSILIGNPQWTALGITAIALYLAHRWWEAHGPDLLKVKAFFTLEKIHSDETTQFNVEIENRFFLPLQVKVLFTLHEKIALEGTRQKPVEKKTIQHEVSLLLPARGTIRHPITATPSHRGNYWLDDFKLHIKDPLGMAPLDLEIYTHPKLLVYPKQIAVQEMERIMREPWGEVLSRKNLLQDDAAFYMGSRGYRRGDPYKRIDWKATAKQQSLQTKIYDFTVHGKVYFAMDMPFVRENDESSQVELEHWISALATLVSFCRRRGIEYKILLNFSLRMAKKFTEIPWGSGKRHYLSVLEILAKLRPIRWISFSFMLQQIEREQQISCGVVVLKKQLTSDDWAALRRLERKGHSIWIVENTAHMTSLRAIESFVEKKEGIPYEV